MKLPLENAYYCSVCRRHTVTVDVAEGVTPALLRCRATEGCTGMARSNFYPKKPRPSDIPPPAWEWYAPDADELAKMDPPMREHCERGGLNIRPRTDAEPLYHPEGA